MRALAGIVLGLIVALIVAVIAGFVAAATTFSVAPGLDPRDTGQVLRALAAMPLATQLTLALAWLLSALAGALVAKAIARRAWPAWVVTLLVAAYFGANALVLPLPLSTKLLWIVGPLLGGWIGERLVRAGAVAASAPTTTDADERPGEI